MNLRRRRALFSPSSARRVAAAGVVATLSWAALATVADAAPASASASLTASSVVGLQEGSRGSNVKAMQQALIAAGVPVGGGADGVFGPATKRALVSFQAARGLPQTGIVDEATANSLAGVTTTTTTGTTTTGTTASGSGGGYVGLQQGAEGSAVKDVQQKLMDFGVYLGSGANGVWDASTTRGVKQFQRWNGLTQTGTINVATEKRLGLDGSTPATAATGPAPTTATATTSSSNPYVGLKQGSQGPLVKELQQALQATGLVVRGGADGVFGAATTSSLKAFQGFNGLTQNGIVSERAAQLLKLGASSTTTTPPAASSPYLNLSAGATGSYVKDVQRALIAAGVNVRGGADGAFGNATKAALTSYQEAVGVTADGTVNQATIDKLGLGSSQSPVPFSGGATNQTTTPPSSSNPYVGLQAGSIGPLVKELQEALLDTGLVIRGGADGVFGSATTTALKAFQSVNGIAQSGVVSERGASLLALGSGSSTPSTNGGGGFTLERFPVQGPCFFGDTWHAPRGGGRQHEGVDVIAAEGKLLYAMVDGEITKFFWDQPGALAGNGLRLEQPNGTYFTYLHMLGFAPGISLGTKVKAGDVIGFVGNTGSSATPHLHLEIHPFGGAAINPYPYVKAIDDCDNDTPQYQSSFS